jgi:hypothetical protein
MIVLILAWTNGTEYSRCALALRIAERDLRPQSAQRPWRCGDQSRKLPGSGLKSRTIIVAGATDPINGVLQKG